MSLFVVSRRVRSEWAVAEDGRPYSQNQTTITPVPPIPNTSVPPEAATEILINLSRPTWVANAEASAQSSNQDLLELVNWRDWTVMEPFV